MAGDKLRIICGPTAAGKSDLALKLCETYNAAIVSAVIQMAHSLKLNVVAEGVERADQLEFLRSQNCDIIQGYFFSKPVPVDELEAFINERKAATA